MHYQIKNGQLVPVSNEEHKKAIEDGKDPKKGVKQRHTAAREELLKTQKEAEDKKQAEAGLAKTVVAGSEGHEHPNKVEVKVEPTIEL